MVKIPIQQGEEAVDPRGITEPIQVLRVEDDPAFADLAATYLERDNDRLVVETAPDAAAGLERFDERIDCIVSDYEMPGMNGIELLETVRETHPNVPFSLFTGKGSEDVASEAVSAGVRLSAKRLRHGAVPHLGQSNYECRRRLRACLG